MILKLIEKISAFEGNPQTVTFTDQEVALLARDPRLLSVINTNLVKKIFVDYQTLFKSNPTQYPAPKPEEFQKLLSKASKTGNLDLVKFFLEEQLLFSDDFSIEHYIYNPALEELHLDIVKYVVQKFPQCKKHTFSDDFDLKKSLYHAKMRDREDAVEYLTGFGATEDETAIDRNLAVISHTKNLNRFKQYWEFIDNTKKMHDLNAIFVAICKCDDIRFWEFILTSSKHITLERLEYEPEASLVNQTFREGSFSAADFLLQHGFKLPHHTSSDQSIIRLADNGDIQKALWLVRNAKIDIALIQKNWPALYRLLQASASDDDIYATLAQGESAWHHAHILPPTSRLDEFSPYGYEPKAYQTVSKFVDLLEILQEREQHERDKRYSYKLAILFHTVEFLETFIKKYFKNSHQIIHDICLLFDLPKFGAWNREGWRNFCLTFGRDALPFIAGAARIEKKLGRVPDSLTEARTVRDSINFYSDTDKKENNKKIADLCQGYGISEAIYLRCIELTPKTHSDLPEVNIDGSTMNLPGYRIRRLLPGDPQGLFLGDKTGCCQSMGKQGASCAIQGYTSSTSDFYVVAKLPKKNAIREESLKKFHSAKTVDEFISSFSGDKSQKNCRKRYQDLKHDYVMMYEKNSLNIQKQYPNQETFLRAKFLALLNTDEEEDIIAQMWAWIATDGKSIVLDSWERRFDKDDVMCKTVVVALAKHFLSQGFSTVYLGTGGHTPKTLSFPKAYPAKPKGHSGFYDSNEQYLIASKEPIAISELNILLDSFKHNDHNYFGLIFKLKVLMAKVREVISIYPCIICLPAHFHSVRDYFIKLQQELERGSFNSDPFMLELREALTTFSQTVSATASANENPPKEILLIKIKPAELLLRLSLGSRDKQIESFLKKQLTDLDAAKLTDTKAIAFLIEQTTQECTQETKDDFKAFQTYVDRHHDFAHWLLQNIRFSPIDRKRVFATPTDIILYALYELVNDKISAITQLDWSRETNNSTSTSPDGITDLEKLTASEKNSKKFCEQTKALGETKSANNPLTLFFQTKIRGRTGITESFYQLVRAMNMQKPSELIHLLEQLEKFSKSFNAANDTKTKPKFH